MKLDKRIAQAILFALSALGASPAHALSGFITGSMTLHNRNGNYCDPALQDCTGAAYLRSSFDVLKALPNARIEIWQGSNVIGQGSTNDNGYFNASWSTSEVGTPAFVRFFSQDKNSRFTVNDTNGARQNTFTGTFTLINGTTSGNPQNIGAWTAGSSANPHWWMNVYWAAELQWRTRFNYVSLLVNNYTGVEIRGLSDNIPGFLGDCPTSCARDKKIQLNASAAFAPQGRIMHEAGHIANQVIKFFKAAPATCFPNTAPPDFDGSTPCAWVQGHPEWASIAFEEGFASFAADSTLWFPASNEPTSCLAQIRCAVNDNTRIELTHFPFATNNCVTTGNAIEKRWPISTMRFIWDVYDDHNDADGDSLTEGPLNYWRIYANLSHFPVGLGVGQINEPWGNASLTVLDNRDGRGATAYKSHYENFQSVNILWVDNCSPL